MKLIKLIPRYVWMEILFLFFLSLTPILWINNGYIILGHDSGFRMNIQHHMQMLWNTFNPSVNTGVDWSLYKGFLIIQLPEFILQTVIGSLQFSQAIIFIFWFFLIIVSMYVFSYSLFPEENKRFFRMYTSVFWAFNFYILQAWFIAERAKFSLYAGLPLSIVILYFTFKRKLSLLIGALLFGGLYFFCNGGGSPPLFGASMIVWTVTWFYLTIFSFLKKEKYSIRTALKIGILFGISFFSFNAYWIIPQIDLIRGTYTSAVSAEGGVEGLIAWEKEISKYASIPNLLRLQGFPDWYGNQIHPYANFYIHNPLLIFLSLIPIFSIVIGSVFLRNHSSTNKHQGLFILFYLLLFLGLFFSAGSHSPTGVLYLLFMKKIPGFAIFRSSFFKFAPVLWFSIIVLSGYYLQIYILKFKNRIIGIGIIIGILLYHFPFFNPSFFKFSNDFSTRIKVPAYVQVMAEELDRQSTTGRVLLMPELDTGFINKPVDTYIWGYYSLDLLPRIISKRTILANDSPYEIVHALYDAVYAGDRETFLRLASALKVNTILYRNDIKHSLNYREISEEKIQALIGPPMKKSGSWSLYPVSEASVNLYSSNTITPLISVKNESMFVSSQSATVNINWDQSKSFSYKTAIFQTECFYCSLNEYQLFIQSIVLPPIKVLPDSLLYSFLVKRTLPSVSSSNPQQNIDSLISISLLKLSEYTTAKIRNKNLLQHNILNEYKETISQILEKKTMVTGRDYDTYSARIYAFLKKESELSDDTVQMFLSQYLQSIEKELWVSDKDFYRYGITLPEGGEYRVIIKNTPDASVLLNGETIINNTVKPLKAGYYRIEANKNNLAPAPLVFFQTEKTTDKSSGTYILPYSFDTRWQIKDDQKHTFIHTVANGYANGWVSQNLTKEPDIEYRPHIFFLYGLLISSFSVTLGVGYLAINFKKRL